MTFRYVKSVCQSWFGAVVGFGEAIGRFHQDEGRARDQAVVLQKPINASLGYKAALGVREVDGELPGRQVRLLEGQVNDRRPDLVGDLVPDPSRSRLAILQSLDPALRYRLYQP